MSRGQSRAVRWTRPFLAAAIVVATVAVAHPRGMAPIPRPAAGHAESAFAPDHTTGGPIGRRWG
jgi:hypothetical protein